MNESELLSTTQRVGAPTEEEEELKIPSNSYRNAYKGPSLGVVDIMLTKWRHLEGNN